MKRWLDWLRGSARAAKPTGVEPLRWVVLDVETSGLDRATDRLLSIGAVAVRDRRIVIADSLELTVRHAHASARDNVLVHGIGEEEQRAGVEPALAMQRFVDYIGTSPLLAFHASFDRAFLKRAAAAWLDNITIDNVWIDVAALARALHPGTGAQALDEWLAVFGIPVEQRHNACGDALLTAMLFLRVVDAVPPHEREPQHLQHIAANARWLGR